MNGVSNITAKIIADAGDAANAAREEAKKQTADILDTYESDVAYIRAAAREAIKKDNEAAALRTASGVAMARRSALLAAKSRAINEAYSEAQDRFLRMSDRERRDFLFSVLNTVLREKAENDRVLTEAYGKDEVPESGSYIVLLSERDLAAFGADFIPSFLERYGASLTEDARKKLMLSDKPAAINGGLILRCGDIESNCSLSMLMSRAREESEAEVSALLFPADKE